MHLFLIVALITHISGGTVAIFSGACAISSPKGGRTHRLAGKTYFWAMTAVFISAMILAIAHDNHFLLAVGFFSYYLVCKGYRSLYLKKLGAGQRASLLDWGIVVVATAFAGYLLWWGIGTVIGGVQFGIVSVVVGAVAIRTVAYDIRKFTSTAPLEKMHWLYGHLGGMGGAYISTLTAVVVVNVQISPTWVWWLLPVSIGLPLIHHTIRRYRRQFAGETGESLVS